MNYYSYEEALKKIEISRTDDSSLDLDNTVKSVISQVIQRQDQALYEYTKTFDHVSLKRLKITPQEIKEAYKEVSKEVIESLLKAKKNIETYHQKQSYDTFEYENKGRLIGQKVTAIGRVGLYIPGGTASYPSSVLMNAVPALIAGVKEIVLVSPPNKEGKIASSILVAADLCGIKEIYSVGGAQAIAALAYGTETIQKVDKIVGPGNQYVAKAKALVSSVVGIDTIAGPSEVCIIADKDTNPTYIAIDMLAQAEHDPNSRSICISTNLNILKAAEGEIKRLIQDLSRKEIALQSINQESMLIYVKEEVQCIDFVNTLAPEHLEILTANPFEIKDLIVNAGAIFLGPYTPEPVGDYIAGPNHTLPTSSFARFQSGLSTYDFLKRTSYVYYSKEAFFEDKEDIIRLAETEGLTAHALSIKVRS